MDAALAAYKQAVMEASGRYAELDAQALSMKHSAAGQVRHAAWQQRGARIVEARRAYIASLPRRGRSQATSNQPVLTSGLR